MELALKILGLRNYYIIDTFYSYSEIEQGDFNKNDFEAVINESFEIIRDLNSRSSKDVSLVKVLSSDFLNRVEKNLIRQEYVVGCSGVLIESEFCRTEEVLEDLRDGRSLIMMYLVGDLYHPYSL